MFSFEQGALVFTILRFDCRDGMSANVLGPWLSLDDDERLAAAEHIAALAGNEVSADVAPALRWLRARRADDERVARAAEEMVFGAYSWHPTVEGGRASALLSIWSVGAWIALGGPRRTGLPSVVHDLFVQVGVHPDWERRLAHLAVAPDGEPVLLQVDPVAVGAVYAGRPSLYHLVVGSRAETMWREKGQCPPVDWTGIDDLPGVYALGSDGRPYRVEIPEEPEPFPVEVPRAARKGAPFGLVWTVLDNLSSAKHGKRAAMHALRRYVHRSGRGRDVWLRLMAACRGMGQSPYGFAFGASRDGTRLWLHAHDAIYVSAHDRRCARPAILSRLRYFPRQGSWGFSEHPFGRLSIPPGERGRRIRLSTDDVMVTDNGDVALVWVPRMGGSVAMLATADADLGLLSDIVAACPAIGIFVPVSSGAEERLAGFLRRAGVGCIPLERFVRYNDGRTADRLIATASFLSFMRTKTGAGFTENR